MAGVSAVSDLGLGSMLGQQTTDETEEEKRKKRLGLMTSGSGSLAAQQLFGFGQAGVASVGGGVGRTR